MISLGVKCENDRTLSLLVSFQPILESLATRDLASLQPIATSHDTLLLDVHINRCITPVASLHLRDCPPFVSLARLRDIIRDVVKPSPGFDIKMVYLESNRWISVDFDVIGEKMWFHLPSPHHVAVDISARTQPASGASVSQAITEQPPLQPPYQTHPASGFNAHIGTSANAAVREYADLSWLDRTPTIHTDLSEIPERFRGHGYPVTTEIDYFLVHSFKRSFLTELARY